MVRAVASALFSNSVTYAYPISRRAHRDACYPRLRAERACRSASRCADRRRLATSRARLVAYRTNAFDQDYAAIGAGFTLSGNSPISLVVDCNGQIGREKSIHGITGGFDLAF